MVLGTNAVYASNAVVAEFEIKRFEVFSIDLRVEFSGKASVTFQCSSD